MAKKSASVGQVRIIAGDWRGRKLPVVQGDGLRPTGDRVRETLFNWLQMQIPGKRCLDLFAGSGALGLEAASRGAASVTLVEAAPQVARSLRQTMEALDAGEQVTLHEATAEQFLANTPEPFSEPFDVVFLDPPFDQHIHLAVLALLAEGCLNPGAMVYVELPSKEADIAQNFPSSFTVSKEKRFGDVTVFLLCHENTES